MKEITGINHVGLRVKDLNVSREFYEKLGFKFIVGPVGPEPVANDIQARYDSFVDNFKREYGKLLNEPLLPRKNELEPVGAYWSQLPRSLDMSSTLAQVQNDYGDRLNYLYFIYRITSFDAHGNNIKSIADDAFGKPCNFPVTKLAYAIDLVANQYLIVLEGMRNRGEI